jgi:hypothetical protein
MNPSQFRALIVDDPIEAWNAAGFAGDDVITIGSTTIVTTAASENRGDGHRHGIVGASIEGTGELDGLQLGTWVEGADDPIDLEHPNGVIAIDHVVVMTPDCDRTTTAFQEQGIDVRRVRTIELPGGNRRQTFFWLGDVICELVGPDEPDGDGPAQWWGLALTVRDLDATVAMLGEAVTPSKPAVQTGRFVSTLRRDIGLGVPILFISEHPPASS